MPGRLCALLDQRGIRYETDAPMSARTTLKVGGAADCLVEARGAEEIAASLRSAEEAGEPVLVIGNGSNLLVKDSGIRGLVIVVGQAMGRVEQQGNTLHAEAGASLGYVAQVALVAGLSGLEALSGIPGTVGGAVCMNAGAYGAEMAGVTVSVDTLDRAGNAATLACADMDFGYRHSAVLAKNLIVTAATLTLTPGDKDGIAAAMRDYAARRRDKQPLTLPSAGSFFKRPEGHFAGALIEGAGLKGAAIGGAQVSEKHAGFLVNKGGATAKDFLDLIEHIQARVYASSGVRLEPEVKILP